MVFPFPTDLPPGSIPFAREVIKRLDGTDARSAALTRKAIEQTAGSAVQASAQATATAQVAQAVAQAAQENADLAYMSASGKNQIVQSVDPASGTENPTTGVPFNDGDVWWQTDSGKVIAQWNYDTGSWVSLPLDEQFLPLVNIGTGTYGTLSGSQLAADAIDGKTITGATIQTNTGSTTGIKLDNTSLRAYNVSGVKTFEVTPTGSVTAAGTLLSSSLTNTASGSVGIGPAGSVWPEAASDIPAVGTFDGVLTFKPSGDYVSQGGIWTGQVAIGGERLAALYIGGPVASDVPLVSYSVGGRAYLEIDNVVDATGNQTGGGIRMTGNFTVLGETYDGTVKIGDAQLNKVYIAPDIAAGSEVHLGYGTEGDGDTLITVRGEPLNINTAVTNANNANTVGMFQAWSPYTNFPTAQPDWVIHTMRGNGNTMKQFATRSDWNTGWEQVRYSSDGGSTWGSWTPLVNNQVTNWNDAITPGFYWGNAATNQPVNPDADNGWLGHVEVHAVSGTNLRIMQTLTPARTASEASYKRVYSGATSTWGSWVRVGGSPLGGTAYPAFQVGLSASQTKTGAVTTTKIPWGTVTFNNGSYYDNTNHRFVAPIDGTYEFSTTIAQTTTTAGPEALFYVNGSLAQLGPISYTTTFISSTVNFITALTEGDYVEIYWRNNNNVTTTLAGGRCFFSGKLLSV